MPNLTRYIGELHMSWVNTGLDLLTYLLSAFIVGDCDAITLINGLSFWPPGWRFPMDKDK